jgi:hypothetical protein
LKLSEKEAMAHINASIVRANVSNTFALYTNECIVSMSFIQEESYYFDTSSSSAIAIFPSSSSLLFCWIELISQCVCGFWSEIKEAFCFFERRRRNRVSWVFWCIWLASARLLCRGPLCLHGNFRQASFIWANYSIIPVPCYFDWLSPYIVYLMYWVPLLSIISARALHLYPFETSSLGKS